MSDIVHCKNAFVAPSDDDGQRRPPHLTAKEKNKGPKKVMTKKKRKHGDADAETAAAMAAAAEHCEVLDD
jgi:hypothetical protein